MAAARPARVFSRPGLLAWCTVRTALSLTATGSILTLVGYIFILLLTLTTIRGGGGGGEFGPRPTNLLAVTITIFTGIGVVGAVLLIVGMLMCLTVPGESGGRGWMLGTLLSLIFAGLLLVLLILLDAQTDPLGFRRDGLTSLQTRFIMLYMIILAIILMHTFFTVFLIAVAGYFHAYGLRVGLFIYLAVSLIAEIIGLLLFVLICQEALGGRAGPPTGLRDPKVLLMLNWAGRAAQVALLIWFFIQTLLTRSTIVDQLLRSGKD